jgi:hypothetical protein
VGFGDSPERAAPQGQGARLAKGGAPALTPYALAPLSPRQPLQIRKVLLALFHSPIVTRLVLGADRL